MIASTKNGTSAKPTAITTERPAASNPASFRSRKLSGMSISGSSRSPMVRRIDGPNSTEPNSAAR